MEILIGLGMLLGAMILPVIALCIQAIVMSILEYKYDVYKLAAQMKWEKEDEKANE